MEPKIQLPSIFGQEGSTWNVGTPASFLSALRTTCQEVIASATTSPTQLAIFLIVFSVGCRPKSIQFISDDLAALHHKLHSLKFSNVFQRVARNSDHIGKFAFVDRANPVLPAQHFRIDHGRGLQGRNRRHSMVCEPYEIQPL